MTVNVRVLGAPLILGVENEPIPENNHRVGSVPIIFDNGRSAKIRVFGYVPYSPSREFSQEFEHDLRLVCEDEAVYSQLYGNEAVVMIAKRFNPAKTQRHRGW